MGDKRRPIGSSSFPSMDEMESWVTKILEGRDPMLLLFRAHAFTELIYVNAIAIRFDIRPEQLPAWLVEEYSCAISLAYLGKKDQVDAEQFMLQFNRLRNKVAHRFDAFEDRDARSVLYGLLPPILKQRDLLAQVRYLSRLAIRVAIGRNLDEDMSRLRRQGKAVPPLHAGFRNASLSHFAIYQSLMKGEAPEIAGDSALQSFVVDARFDAESYVSAMTRDGDVVDDASDDEEDL